MREPDNGDQLATALAMLLANALSNSMRLKQVPLN
jgi:hypothetical protein